MIRWLVLAVCSVVLFSACTTTGGVEDERLKQAAQYNVQLGINYLQKGNLPQASAKLEKALEQDPSSAQAHNAYAILQERLGQLDLAGQHYKRAVRLDPEYSEAHNNYGRFLCSQGDLSAADREFMRAVENPLYSNPEGAYTNAGVCALRMPDVVKAEDYFRKALAKNPDYLPALYEMALITFEQKNYLQTRAFLQRYDAVRAQIVGEDAGARKFHPQMLWLCVQSEMQLGNRSAATVCALRLKNYFPESRETAQLLEMERNGRVN